jgi:hypothetical protein
MLFKRSMTRQMNIIWSNTMLKGKQEKQKTQQMRLKNKKSYRYIRITIIQILHQRQNK